MTVGLAKGSQRAADAILPSRPLIRIHGEGAVGRAGVDALAPGARPGGAQRGEEGQEMLVARMVARGIGGAASVVDELVGASRRDGLGQPVGEIADPGRGRRVDRRHAQLAEIMRRAARAEDQHALVAQRPQRLADLEFVRGAEMGLHRELRHRNVGLRIHQHQRHPGAVIEAARREAGRQAGAGEQRGGALGEGRGARRGVAHRVEGGREAVEIMDRFRPGRRAQRRGSGFPMGRHREDGGRPAQPGAVFGEEAAGGGLAQRQRRRAVRNEGGGKSRHALPLGPCP
jgi:hypothetical protein